MTKLNLGCGFDYKEGYINCDVRGVKADKYLDLNKFPYPFKDNSADGVLISHTLEHLDKPVDVLTEIYRICKVGARVIIQVPYFSSESAFSDIEHKHYFTFTTFDAINQNNPVHNRSPFYNKCDFKIIRKRLIWRKQLFFFNFFNLLPRIYQELFCWWFPAKELMIEMEAKKEKIKSFMKDTCFGSISYCCGLEKECKHRDNAIKRLGLTKSEFIKLKDKFDENLLSLLRVKK